MEIDRTSQTWIDGKRIVVDFYRVATGTDELNVPMDALKETIAAVESMGIYASITAHITQDNGDSDSWGTEICLELMGHRQMTEAEMKDVDIRKQIQDLRNQHKDLSAKNMKDLPETLYKQIVLFRRTQRFDILVKIHELEVQMSTHVSE